MKDVFTAPDMWVAIQNIFQKRRQLNRLDARRNFYVLEVVLVERVIRYINRAKKLCTYFTAMDVSVIDQELAVTVIGRLPIKKGHLIVAINAVADDKKYSCLTFPKVGSYKKSSEVWNVPNHPISILI